MFTRSANELARILLITRSRCALTVRSVVPSSAPACLFKQTSGDQTENIAFAGREGAVAFFEFDTLKMLSALRAREIGAARYRDQ